MALPPGFRLRAMREGEEDDLAALEWRAARLFADHGYPAIAAEPPRTTDQFRQLVAGRETWVAEDSTGRAVGFAVGGARHGIFWLDELAVDPAFGRRGIGAALLHVWLDAARRRSFRQAGLTTFRDIAFNAPFYARHGFAEAASEQICPELAGARIAETPPGVDPCARVLMLRTL